MNLLRRTKHFILIWSIAVTFLTAGLFFAEGQPGPVVKAQSTGDSLPTRTPIPRPVATPTPNPTLTPTAIPKTWVGRLVSNTLGVTEGTGSIFRVKVEGITGARIELRSEDELITGESGSKPEYGPYTAEFAPVTAGIWTVSVPELGVSLDVTADNYNLAVIEFIQIPAPEATRAGQPTVTPTSWQGQLWQARLAGEASGPNMPFARLLVQVVGLSNHPVRLSTVAEVINTANTGQKPQELGPDVVEFTALTPGKYIIEPLYLNSRFEVDLKANIETRVEFYPVSPPTATATLPPPSATSTPAPPTQTPPPTITPSPTDTATPTVTPLPTQTPTPLPTPTPATRWLGVVAERRNVTGGSILAVRVSGLQGVPVRLRVVNGNVNSERRCLTGQDGEGQDICAFKNLTPGQYVVTPEGLGLSLPTILFENEKVVILFDLEVLPPGITGWQARLQKNTNGVQAVEAREAVIRVWVMGQVGQVIALRSVRGTEQLCEVVPNPILGGLVCEFGALRPGVYLVEALNTGASQKLFVDGVGLAEIVFSPNATYATQSAALAPPVVGTNAQPYQPATATPIPAALTQTWPPTATPSPSPTLTPTPAFAWQGRVVETVNGVNGTIGVRAAGLKDHPVILRSGDWQSAPQLTGTKPELGDYATEFGGLAQGEYIVALVDLAELKVTLGPDQFMLVEFRYDFVNPPKN
ncbi:MAG: hypothetical protein JW953_01180 [Anaerolineae bacterium]|nr:hypothetical protein [Anaerolineae bacterium]